MHGILPLAPRIKARVHDDEVAANASRPSRPTLARAVAPNAQAVEEGTSDVGS